VPKASGDFIHHPSQDLLEDMAAEYRKLADFVERQSQPVPRERTGVPTLAV
jgi:hypothetical protein